MRGQHRRARGLRSRKQRRARIGQDAEKDVRLLIRQAPVLSERAEQLLRGLQPAAGAHRFSRDRAPRIRPQAARANRIRPLRRLYAHRELPGRPVQLHDRVLCRQAFKLAAGEIGKALEANRGAHPRSVPLEAHFAALLPELVWMTTPEDLARIAAEVFTHTPPTVALAHLHDPAVPVREQAELLVRVLRERHHASFHELVADAASTAVVVSRFLALLELYRRSVVEFTQEEALASLQVTWTGGDGEVDLAMEEYAGGDAPGEESS